MHKLSNKVKGICMNTCKHTQMRVFSIKSPRYHDKRVLLAAFKVGQHNKILFTQAPSMGTEPYYISGKVAKKFKKETNGVIPVYSVPLDKLELLEIKEHCEHEWQ